MESNISRRGFLAAGALGTSALFMSPKLSFAETGTTATKSLSSGLIVPEGGIALNYVDTKFPEARVLVVDPDNDLPQTINPDLVSVNKSLVSFDDASNEGTTEYEFAFKGIHSDQELSSAGKTPSLASSNTANKSDSIVSVKATATWTLSGNEKKINLKSVKGKISPKLASVSNRCIIIQNENKIRKKLNFSSNTISHTLSWGYQEFHDGRKDLFHFVNIWFNAKASGMGGKKEIVCFFTYGSK